MLHSSTSVLGHDQTDEHCLFNHMSSDCLVLGSHSCISTASGCPSRMTAAARPVVVHASPQTGRASALSQSPARGRNLTGKGCTVCAGARNLGSFVLDDFFRRRKIRAQGFMLNARSEPLQQRILRQNGQSLLSSSFPEGSAARFCDFSSDFMALATHMSLSLASHSATLYSWNPCCWSSSIRNSPAPCAARAVIGHLVHCLMLQDSLGHTRHRLLLRRLDHGCILCASLRRL